VVAVSSPTSRRRPTRRRILGAAAACALAAGGRAAASGDGSDEPRRPREPQTAPLGLPVAAPEVPRTAWVFGSGGPRGFVHVGVLEGLAALGLEPDFIVGASAGALAGTLWAAGLGARRLEQLALDLQPWDVLRWNPRGPEWFDGRGLAAFVNEALGGRPLQDLPVPVACVATRTDNGEVVAFTRGDAGVAVQAASAIVGRLAPVSVGGVRYVDADLQQPLPVRVARALGATRVLAVDASAHEDNAPRAALRYRETDLHKRALTLPDARLADVLLHPDTGYWAGWSRAYRERLIATGEAAVHAQAARVIALHAGDESALHLRRPRP
jgi:NTE family protein